jgi:hypothetical protein
VTTNDWQLDLYIARYGFTPSAAIYLALWLGGMR